MNVIQEVIELWNRGEYEAAALLIDSDDALGEIMEQEGFDHEGLVQHLIKRNAGR